MAVICCATPSELYLEETRSTLQFASRAKLVKTNAQVNEVLDDRSIIRRLQKELAEARRNSTAPGTEHLRALETRAVTAGTAAMEAKAKLDRLKESILNAGYLFGAQNETENVENQSSMLRIGDNNRKAKKRRQSDGEILLNFRSPSKILIASNGATPLTEPKKRKKKQIRHLKVSPKSELYIVREALSSRTKFTKALQNTVKQLKESISDIEDRFKQEKVVNENQVGEFQLRYAELEQEKAKDESEIAFSAAENQKLSAEGEDLRSQYEDLQNRYCHLKQQQNQLSSENKAAQQQNIGLVAELENFKVQINEVESLLSTEEEKARSLKENFEATEEHLSSIAHDKLRLERELEDTKQEYSKTIQTLKEEKDGLTTELDKSCRKNNVLLANHVTLEKDSDDISARLSSTEQLVVDLQSQLEAAQQVTVNQETEKHTLKTFLIEAQETISALEQKIVSADEQITQICADKESKMSQQEQAYKELESRFTASRTEVESLTVEKASDQEIVASLEHKLIEFEEQIDQVSEEKESIVSILETRLVTSQQEVESLKTENTDAHGTINSLQDQINQVRTEKESLVSELEKNLADVNQQVKLLKSEKGSAQKVIASLEQKLIEYEEEMEQVNEEKESIISNIENRLTASQKEVHLLKAEKAETDGTIAALKQKVLSEQEQNDCLCKEKKSIISDLEEKESVVSDLESRLAASKEDFDSLNSKMTQTQEHATSLERNLTATKEQMEQNKTELEQQIASTNEELATKNDENKCLQTTIYDSQQTISSFEEKLASTEEQFEQLFGEISELQGLIETSGRNLESLKSEKMDLEARKDSLEKEKAELDIKRQELENENTEISADKESIIAEQKEAYMELEARLGDLFKGLESLQSEKGALEQKLVATEVKMEKVSSEKEAVASELHIRLVESSRKIESLQAQKYDLETRIEELESGLDCQLQELEEKSLKLEAENDELKNEVFNSGVKDVEIESEIMQAKTKMTAVLAQKDALEATLSESQLHAHQLEDRLDFARAEKKEYLTTTALRLDEQQKMIDEMTKRKEELESEVMALKKIENDFEHKQTLKENLTKRLHEREVERDEVTLELEKQYERNRELSRSLADCLPKEKETQLLSDISELKTQNIEFKQLLMSSNESEERSRNVVSELESECNTKTRELHDVLYRVSQLEEELRLSEKPGNNGSKQHQDELLDELEALASEKAETQNLLKREREERFIAEEELKKKMGDEQRILINEAESRMTDLRIRTENLERSLEQSEAEGYRARQVAEELRDQNKDVEERCVNYEGTVTGLNSSIERQESQISGLQSELNRAKADSYALKESAIEMKDKVRKASRDNEKAFRESQIASSELAALKRKIASLEHNLAEKRDESDRLRMKLRATEQEDASRKTGETVKELQETIQSKDDLVVNLNSTVAKLASQNASLATELKTSQATILKSQGNEDSNRLQKNIVRLNDQMRQKDSRIKKLEAVRLTKEQVESIKKLKVRFLC
jgi:chromosome segregation ATPase